MSHLNVFDLVDRYIELKIADATPGADVSYVEFLEVENTLKERLKFIENQAKDYNQKTYFKDNHDY
jgi:hypothetical protein